MAFSGKNLAAVEAHLANNPTLAEGGVPGPIDAHVFFQIDKLPDLKESPNTHYWYLFIKSFAPNKLKAWAEKCAPKKQEKKEEEEFDPFAEDDTPAEKVEKKPEPKAAAKPKKAKPVAKTILVFDVKVYDEQADLDDLAKKVLALKIDGLVWNNEPKQIEVVFNVKKLQFGCIIEDDKVLTDDIFDKILEWEDIVQSVDMVSMQKL